MSVEDNLQLGAAIRGEARTGLARAYELFPRLAARRRQSVRSMSGGEQQMVAIGRALMSDPTLLLLDEPSGGLAPVFVTEIGRVVQRLKAEGTTVLMVEQNVRLALAVADRFVALRDGQVLAQGPVSDLQGAYEDLVRRIYL
jgi:branched-chain amino acid transport system ATP-binding protein